MAKQINVGVDGVVKKVKEVPLCIDGVVKKAKKGVCGVGGVVKEFFASAYQLFGNVSMVTGSNKQNLLAREITGGYKFVTESSYGGNGGLYACVSTSNKIDITNYSTLSITYTYVNSFSTNTNQCYMKIDVGSAISSSLITGSVKSAVSYANAWTVGETYTITADISSLSGSYYLGIIVGAYKTPSGNREYVRATDFKLS